MSLPTLSAAWPLAGFQSVSVNLVCGWVDAAQLAVFDKGGDYRVPDGGVAFGGSKFDRIRGIG